MSYATEVRAQNDLRCYYIEAATFQPHREGGIAIHRAWFIVKRRN